MKDVGQVRNLAVAGHGGCGKTSLCDLILFKAGAVERRGRVEQKTSVSDYTPDEQEKLSSIYATPLFCTWQNTDLFMIDTPGYGEFIGEASSAIRACDNILVVIDAASGLDVGSTRAWKIAREQGKPRFFFINKLDGERADYFKTLEQLQEAYGKTVCVPFTLPIGNNADFKSVHHVIRSTEAAPQEIEEYVKKYKELLMDTIAESDEALMTRYLDGEELSESEISKGLHKAIQEGSLVPVFAGSVEKDIGITELMNSFVNLYSHPLATGKIKLNDGAEIDGSVDGEPLALVFKSVVDPFIGQMTFFKVRNGVFKSDSEVFNVSTQAKERFGTIMIMDGKTQIPVDKVGPGTIAAIAKLKNTKISNTLSSGSNAHLLPEMVFPKPVMSYAVTAVKSGEDEKIISGLSKLAECDPTMKISRHEETHELLLSGMGDQHLHIIIKKLKDNAKVDVNLKSPKIPYRETITSVADSMYRHKKQSGGHGQFAEVHLRVAPNEAGFEFVNDIVGGAIPRNFIPAVEKGVVEAMARGPLAGCTVENMKVSVYDGKFHPVDSSEMAFKIASRMAFRKAMEMARPVLLEPIMKVAIMVPDDYTGDITGDLNHKRGRILGMGVEEGFEVVNAEVPLVEMSKYATELRSMTHGRGQFEMEFSRYEVVPAAIAGDIINKFKVENQHLEE
ncbi:MAG: hypothetical protein A2020_05780 [Lentisphaerae bacterium GWF2_45_14]|nr:MAG: hypothetical protein A2020_05780 [Lentisphaerae bacterium GWF2_45_14]